MNSQSEKEGNVFSFVLILLYSDPDIFVRFSLCLFIWFFYTVPNQVPVLEMSDECYASLNVQYRYPMLCIRIHNDFLQDQNP
jgi:hypothetical protein